MDDELQGLLVGEAVPGSPQETRVLIKDHGTGQIEIPTPDGPRLYRLKGLRELYGKGRGSDASVDPKDAHYQPLLGAIEEEIVRFHGKNAWLTDAAVSLSLGKLSMALEGEQSDPLAMRIQAALCLAVSLNDYSRQEVRQSLRHVIRSVERHTKMDGLRGYLQFIREFFPGI